MQPPGGTCPTGFVGGGVFWDDENSNNGNRATGSQPDGYYGNNTAIYFCCRNDSDVTSPINLPHYQPFYLFPYTDGCQAVGTGTR